jgi:hypothetical protein
VELSGHRLAIREGLIPVWKWGAGEVMSTLETRMDVLEALKRGRGI